MGIHALQIAKSLAIIKYFSLILHFILHKKAGHVFTWPATIQL